MRRGGHSRSIPQAPPCGLCFLGKWLMSYDLKRNLGLRTTNRPSAAFLKNSSVDKVRDSIVEFNSRFRQSLKRRSGKKIRTAQKGCEASKVESASDPRSPGL